MNQEGIEGDWKPVSFPIDTGEAFLVILLMVVFSFLPVGRPESQFLELKARFPDEGFKG